MANRQAYSNTYIQTHRRTLTWTRMALDRFAQACISPKKNIARSFAVPAHTELIQNALKLPTNSTERSLKSLEQIDPTIVQLRY